MKKILIYGDSNLWGFDITKNKRMEDKYQWANMLGKYFENEVCIIQEGLPGRVAGEFDEEDKYKNGKSNFEAIFKSCSPLDYVIIALGSNDLQIKYERNAEQIYQDLMWYKKIVDDIYSIPKYKQRFFKQMPKFIYVLPGNFDYQNDAKELFDYSCELERKKLFKLFKKSSNNYIELNNIDLIKNDGVHYSTQGQKMVFNIVKDYLEEVLEIN